MEIGKRWEFSGGGGNRKLFNPASAGFFLPKIWDKWSRFLMLISVYFYGLIG